jgi:hypothetical protein
LKKIKGYEVDIAVSRGKNSNMRFTAYDRNIDIDVGRAALG